MSKRGVDTRSCVCTAQCTLALGVSSSVLGMSLVVVPCLNVHLKPVFIANNVYLNITLALVHLVVEYLLN